MTCFAPIPGKLLADTENGQWCARAAEEASVASQEFNVLALLKGDERYVYVYDDVSREALVEALHAHAADPQLRLNWFDAAVLTQKAEEQLAGNPSSPGPLPDAPKTSGSARF